MKQYIRYPDGYDTNQQAFERQTGLLWMLLKLISNLFVYSPLLFTGYIIATKIMHIKDIKSLSGIGMILLFATLLYAIIQGIKAFMLSLKSKQNLFWIPLFLICISFTCGLSVLIMFEPISMLIASVHKGGSDITSWIIAGLFGLYVYNRYHFLKGSH